MRFEETLPSPLPTLSPEQAALCAGLYEKEAVEYGTFGTFKVHREFPGAGVPLAKVRVNADKLVADEFFLALAAGELVRLIESLEMPVEALAGVPSGGTSLADKAGELMSKRRGPGVNVIPVVKNNDGSFSVQSLSEGAPRPRVAVIEDVLTTGTSSLKLVQALVGAGYEVVVVVALVDREQWAARRLAKIGVLAKAVVTLKQIIRAGKLSADKQNESLQAEDDMRSALEKVFREELS